MRKRACLDYRERDRGRHNFRVRILDRPAELAGTIVPRGAACVRFEVRERVR
jgi:hypothetical protein